MTITDLLKAPLEGEMLIFDYTGSVCIGDKLRSVRDFRVTGRDVVEVDVYEVIKIKPIKLGQLFYPIIRKPLKRTLILKRIQ